MNIFRISALILILLSILSCKKEGNSDEGNKKTKSEELQTFVGIAELYLDGYFQECMSDKRIKVKDKSQNGMDEFRRLKLPRLQPAYVTLKGYVKEDHAGEYIELKEVYDVRRKIPEDCTKEPMPYGVLASMKKEFRLQINPYDNMLRFQDKTMNEGLDFPYYPPRKEGDKDIFESSIKTKDSEHTLKVTLYPDDCTKPYDENAGWNHAVDVEFDGKSYSTCASKTL